MHCHYRFNECDFFALTAVQLVWVYLCVCGSVSMCVCVYICLFVSVFVCVCVQVFVSR